MIWQLHHQFADGHTEFVSQRGQPKDNEFREWIEQGQKSHPLPEGATWLVCNEESEFFVWRGGQNGEV
jgi:hypothetical protein